MSNQLRNREKINLDDSFQDIAMKLSEGNPGALTVILKLFADEPDGIMAILGLDDMNMRGPQIWIAFKDHCGEDLKKLKECVFKRDADMVDTVNCESGMADKAVTGGASFR